MKKSLLILLAALAFARCGDGNVFQTSTGTPYELFVICPDPVWRGPAGDSLRDAFLAPVGMLNQPEPLFDVRRIDPAGYGKLMMVHRNQLIVDIDPKYAVTNFAAIYDLYAKPQIIVTAMSPSLDSLAAYVGAHKAEVVKIFEMAEQDRFLASLAKEKHHQPDLEKRVKDKFGIEMLLPLGYKFRSEHPDFMWISYEYPSASQGFFIYTYPHADNSDFTPQALLARRNEFAALIPGPSDGSYMTSNSEFDPDVRNLRINGRLWIEMRGYWDVEGAFMGGPFVSYTTLNETTNRIVTIDCYVFSPKKPKRNYLRELENLMLTVNLDFK